MKIIGKYIIGSLVLLFSYSVSLAQNVIDQVDTSYEGITKLVVRGSFCDVNVVGGSGSGVSLNGKITGSGDNSKDLKIMHRQSGNTLEVWIDRPNRNSNWSWGWNNMNGKLDLKVPAQIDLMVDNSSGNVGVQGITYATCDISASSGDVKAEKMTTDLKIRATSGDISAEQIKGSVKARTTSGSQRLSAVTGKIDAEATSGDIRIDTAEGDIAGETTSGSWDIENAKGAFDLRSTSGDIEGKNIMLTSSSNFRSSSGEIDMRLKNDMKALSFDLQASSGFLRAGEIRSERKLLMKNGGNSIEIRGISSSGSQSYME
ncbi:MAG: hypothetical protein EAZ08_08055 [Cytophagales bacterium]|nr:MAG: hypothetical protein EAZ08_08055 [Cytophagales bacterium]